MYAPAWFLICVCGSGASLFDSLSLTGWSIPQLDIHTPSDPIVGNSYAMKHPAKYSLPDTLMNAANRLKQSKVARELFGDAFVDHFAASREWEEREFRKHITDWELQRYFEII